MTLSRLIVLGFVVLLTGCGGGGDGGGPTGPGNTNRNPTVNLDIDNTHLGYGHTATATLTASDPDGDQLTFTWAATRGTVSSSGSTATSATFTAGNQWGQASVTVTASDGKGGSAQASAMTYIRNPTPPRLCVGPGVGCTGNVYQLAIKPDEAVILTTVGGHNLLDPNNCNFVKNYGSAGVSLPAGVSHAFADLECATCSSAGSNLAWSVSVAGRRPEPDGGLFTATVQWNPTSSQPGACNQ